MIGSLETVVENLLSRRESLGVNYVTVQQSQIELFAPVVDRLTRPLNLDRCVPRGMQPWHVTIWAIAQIV